MHLPRVALQVAWAGVCCLTFRVNADDAVSEVLCQVRGRGPPVARALACGLKVSVKPPTRSHIRPRPGSHGVEARRLPGSGERGGGFGVRSVGDKNEDLWVSDAR